MDVLLYILDDIVSFRNSSRYALAMRVERGFCVWMMYKIYITLARCRWSSSSQCSSFNCLSRAEAVLPQAQDLLPSFIHSHQVIKLPAHHFFSPISLCMIHAECDCQTIESTFFLFSFFFLFYLFSKQIIKLETNYMKRKKNVHVRSDKNLNFTIINRLD